MSSSATDTSMKECCTTSLSPISSSYPEGKVIDIGGISSYVVGSDPHYIFFCTDAFGYEYPNNRSLCNRFAANGFTVVMPKILHDGIPENFDRSKFPEWKERNPHSQANAWADQAFEAIVKSGTPKPESIQVTGYCYGGKTVFHFLTSTWSAHLKGAVATHPSMLSDEEAKEANANVPILFNCAEVDQSFTPAIRETFERILRERGAKTKFVDYKGVSHGFAIRNVSGTEEEKTRREECTVETINFFKANAKGSS